MTTQEEEKAVIPRGPRLDIKVMYPCFLINII